MRVSRAGASKWEKVRACENLWEEMGVRRQGAPGPGYTGVQATVVAEALRQRHRVHSVVPQFSFARRLMLVLQLVSSLSKLLECAIQGHCRVHEGSVFQNLQELEHILHGWQVCRQALHIKNFIGWRLRISYGSERGGEGKRLT